MIHLALDWLDSPAADWLWWVALGVILGAVLSNVDRGRSPLAVILLLACAVTGCASTAPGAAGAMSTWVFYVPASPEMLVMGATTRTLCEATREKWLEGAPHTQPSPCVRSRVTAD